MFCKESETMKLDLSKVRNDLSNLIKLEQTYKKQIESLSSELSKLKDEQIKSAQLQSELAAVEEENKLIITQLHQTQEAFEKYLLETDGATKKELAALQQKLAVANISIEQFNQYYKMVAGKSVSEQSSFPWLKKIFAKKTQIPNLKTNIVNKVGDFSALNQVLLTTDVPAWIDVSVKPSEKLDVYANILYRNIPLCIRKKALICFQYIDGNGNHVRNIYGKSPYSDKFNSNFGYLEPSIDGYQRVYSFVVPNSIAKLKVGLVSFGLYPGESVLVDDTIYIVKNTGA